MVLGYALKELVHRARTTQKDLALKAGYKSSSAITIPIMKNDMNVSTLLRFANTAGYDIMMVRRNPEEEELPIRIDLPEGDEIRRIDGRTRKSATSKIPEVHAAEVPTRAVGQIRSVGRKPEAANDG